jgi:hypothetical protein
MSLICTIHSHGGVPTVFINGEPKILLAYKLGPRDSATQKSFARAGYSTAHCNIKIDELWPGPNQFDPGPMHRGVQTILESNPSGFVITELHANAPDWWVREHPEEQQIDSSGLKYGQSMASPVWLRETEEVIDAYVRETEKQYGDHVVLYMIGAGHTWEWFHRTPLRYVIDCSAVMQRAYTSWLGNKYGTDRNLSRAWSTDISFEKVSIPEWSDVIQGDIGSIRNPGVRRPIYDFFEFYNELLADLVIYFGKVVKKACGSNKLYGAFYGHIFDWLDNPLTAQHSGHFCLEKILASKFVDVLAGPNSYMNRDAGHEASFTAPIESLQLHDKLWLAETDTRTHLADPIQDFCGRPSSLEESIVLLKRDFCHALLRGIDMVWFSLFDGWFSDPSIMSFMAQARNISSAAIRTDRSSAAQIAVIVDERSILASTGRDAYRVDPFISREPRATDMLSHIGCPYDFFLATDLQWIDEERYRVFIFINTVWLSEDLRSIINQKLKRDKRTLVWIGYPGLVKDDVKESNISDLTDMRISLIQEPADTFIRILWDNHPITYKTNLGNLQPTWVDGDFEGHFGTNQLLSPRVCVEDANAIPLGLYSRDGKVGFAVKENKNWNSVFVGAPFLPPSILRQIALWSGVHLYNQSDAGPPDNRDEFERAGWNPDDVTNPGDDILYVNNNFVALHVKYRGRRRIVLPDERNVVDVFNGRIIAEKSRVIELDCPTMATYLFYIGHIPFKELF